MLGETAAPRHPQRRKERVCLLDPEIPCPAFSFEKGPPWVRECPAFQAGRGAQIPGINEVKVSPSPDGRGGRGVRGKKLMRTQQPCAYSYRARQTTPERSPS